MNTHTHTNKGCAQVKTRNLGNKQLLPAMREIKLKEEKGGQDGEARKVSKERRK